jgi:protein associated with RNAse G/E
METSHFTYQPGEMIRVEAHNLDGSLRKWWRAQVIRCTETEVVLLQSPGVRMTNADGTFWTSQHSSDLYFWTDAWYNLFRFYSPEGEWTGDYYNVAQPPVRAPGRLVYVDLELDVYAPVGKAPFFLDEDELAEAAFPPDLDAKIRQIGNDLLALSAPERSPAGPIFPRPQQT